MMYIVTEFNKPPVSNSTPSQPLGVKSILLNKPPGIIRSFTVMHLLLIGICKTFIAFHYFHVLPRLSKKKLYMIAQLVSSLFPIGRTSHGIHSYRTSHGIHSYRTSHGIHSYRIYLFVNLILFHLARINYICQTYLNENIHCIINWY